MTSDETTRAKLSAAIQATLHEDDGAEEAGIDGSLLTGFVVIAEWATPDDEFAITVRTGGNGDAAIPWWRARGLMAYAADEMWVACDGDPEEDEEED